MPSDFTKFFTELGLSAPETAVYLANLQLGPTSVQEIAKKARLSRTTAYDAIASLQEHGLISTYDHGKKKFFAAEDPERAVAHFRDQVAKMQAQVEALSRVIPEMKMIAGGERPTVRFFEGREAILALYSDFSKVNPKALDELSNFKDIDEFLDMEYVKDVRKLIDPQKINIRILHRGAPKTQPVPRPGVEHCELLPELGDFHGDIWIYGDRVAFLAFRGKIVSIIIESEPFAQTVRVLFNAAWKICSKG